MAVNQRSGEIMAGLYLPLVGQFTIMVKRISKNAIYYRLDWSENVGHKHEQNPKSNRSLEKIYFGKKAKNSALLIIRL